MIRANVRLLAIALGFATLPLAACRHNDRYDRYESSAYQNDHRDTSSKMSNSTDNTYNRNYDNNQNDATGNTGSSGSPYGNRDNQGYRSDNTGNTGSSYRSSSSYDNSGERGTTEPGSTSFSRLTGNLSTTLDASFDKAQSAAEKAFTDLGYTITDRKNEDKKSVLEAKSPEKDSVKITLKRKSDMQTDATIGVGMTGKQSRADLVLEKLLDDLK